MVQSEAFSTEFFNNSSSLFHPDFNSLKYFRTEVNKFLQNIVNAFNLDIGEIFTFERNDRFRPYSASNDIDDKYNYRQFAKFKKHFKYALQTSCPINLDGPANLNTVAFPLFDNGSPLGVVVLRGSLNGNPHSFDGMPVNVIRNLITVISRGMCRERSFHNLCNALQNPMNEFLHNIDEFDSSKAIHCNKTSENAGKVAARIGLLKSALQKIKLAAFFHDIGKIFVPSEILRKPGSLTQLEWKIMKLHSDLGSKIISLLTGHYQISEIIATHHEHYDGSGYPYGLSERNIPLASRILAIVDSFAAMTESRIYQYKKSNEEAKKELIDFSGTQFDPDLVNLFLETI